LWKGQPAMIDHAMAGIKNRRLPNGRACGGKVKANE
jgi:hypothetical protein